ncbi:MAG TPA: chaperone modulator CbpM [Candidatus Angelobacter sp.]|nr:chaperone modulator CbpM [Candidatus Angelobacter sp.]
MMFSLQQVVTEIGVTETDLQLWIDQRWVLPHKREDSFIFDDVDIARARLIRELRVDLMVNEEAIPVVLSLLDQVHALRRALARVNSAIDTASPAAKAEIAKRLDAGD